MIFSVLQAISEQQYLIQSLEQEKIISEVIFTTVALNLGLLAAELIEKFKILNISCFHIFWNDCNVSLLISAVFLSVTFVSLE